MFVMGQLLIDAHASALNNAGNTNENDPTAPQTDNTVQVKYIWTYDKRRIPYVAAQSLRYWLRTQLAKEPGWKASPVFREPKIAYSDAEPITFDEDDIFGYMRAASKSTEEKRAAKRAEIAAQSTPVDPIVGELTRTAPFAVGTITATTSTRITRDFGVMARGEGNPVPHEHQFYLATLTGSFGLDLQTVGTFFDGKRTGYKNVDPARIALAQKAGAVQVELNKMVAWRMPLDVRKRRTGMLLRAIGRLEGGAKRTLHLTDTSPAVLVFAVCKYGNPPFTRLFQGTEDHTTVFRDDVFEEVLRIHGPDMVSDVYIGWARGFLDDERRKLDVLLKTKEALHGKNVHVGHPREIADQFVTVLESRQGDSWFE